MNSSSKHTCWFFGDSFTRGNGCLPGDPYYKLTPDAERIRWTTAVSTALGMNEVNTAIGGESNIGILSSILSNLVNIKDGDKVIVGDTRPIRVHSFNEKKQRVNVINDPHFNYTRGNSKYILDYIYYEILPKEDLYLTFYQNLIENTLRELSRRNIPTYYWKHTNLWFPTSKFEIITEASNGKVENRHWSWGGHKNMADYMLNFIENSNII